MTTTEIKKGVYVHVRPSTNFATAQIQVNLTNNLQLDTIGQRILAANMVETVSANYSSQAKMARRQSELYGADWSVDVFKTGQLHTIRANLNLVNDALLPNGEVVFTEGLSFVRDSIFAPMGNEQAGFDLTVFTRQKEVALDELAGLSEDKQYLAIRQAMQTYFDDAALSIPAYGSEVLLAPITPQQAWQEWFRALDSDRIDIIVFGNVDETAVLAEIAQWPLTDREFSLNLRYRQPVKQQLVTKQVQDEVNQARLVMAYQLNVTSEDRFKAYVFNMLFGGNAVSRLFLHVREEAGLAYAISSDYNLYSGLLLVDAGVDRQEINNAQERIAEEVVRLQTELVTPAELAMMKQLMQADFLADLDRPNQQVDRVYVQAITKHATTQQTWMEAVEAVTAEDVRSIAQQVQLQTIYTMEPGADNAEINA